jgi:FkbM family methyltransferase
MIELIKRKLKKYLFHKWSSKLKHYRISIKRNKRWYGNNYGGFYLCPDLLNSESIVYSFGIGEDISFGTSIIKKHNCSVYGFDPTPKSIKWIDEQKLPKKYFFNSFGIALETGSVNFFLPRKESNVSGSYVLQENVSRDNTITVQMKSLLDIKNHLGHKRIDVLKMDIEGAEYDILMNLDYKNLNITQIIVEFHDRMFDLGEEKSKKVINKLKTNNYEIFGVSDTFEEISFIKTSLID